MTAQTPPTAPPTERSVAPSTAAPGGAGSRAAALTGVVFVATIVGSVVVGGGSPNTNASSAHITHYYLTHKGRLTASAVLTGIAVIAGLSFALYLRTHLRRHVPDWMTTLFFTGVVFFAISGTLGAGISIALSDHPQLLTSDGLRLLNNVQQNLNWAPLAVGMALTYIAIGLMIRASSALPNYLAVIAFLLAACGASFVFAFVPFLLTPVFALIASVRLAQRNPDVSGVIRV